MKVAIVGGSIGGLSAATVLHRLGCEVKVFEKSATPFKGRGGSIGYCNVPLWEEIAGRRMLRRGVQASRAQGAYVYGDLWNYWNDCLPAGTISYNQTITELGDDSLHPTIQGEPFDLAIIADGSWSALRSRYFGPSQPQYAGYNVYRFRVLKEHCPWFGAEGQYNSGRYFTILMTIAMDNGQDWLMGGTSVPAEESEIKGWRVGRAGDNRQDGDSDQSLPDWFLPLYKQHFGHLAGGQLIKVMEAAAQKGKIAMLPQYEFAAREVVNGRRVLVGDAAHTASPRTAAGAHTAVLDALGLFEAFQPVLQAEAGAADWGATVDAALASYATGGVIRASELYARSLQVSAPVRHPNWPGAACSS